MDSRPTRTRTGSWWSQRVRGFACAARGLWWLVSGEPHARVHACATLLVILVGAWLGLAAGEWCAVLLAIGLVWLAEGVNSALETLADHVAPEEHPMIGRAKDLAAGAVLASAVIAAIIGGLVFLPRLLPRLGF